MILTTAFCFLIRDDSGTVGKLGSRADRHEDSEIIRLWDNGAVGQLGRADWHEDSEINRLCGSGAVG
jgi:hypothetical protein